MIMDRNKDEALRCVRIAEEAIPAGNRPDLQQVLTFGVCFLKIS